MPKVSFRKIKKKRIYTQLKIICNCEKSKCEETYIFYFNNTTLSSNDKNQSLFLIKFLEIIGNSYEKQNIDHSNDDKDNEILLIKILYLIGFKCLNSSIKLYVKDIIGDKNIQFGYLKNGIEVKKSNNSYIKNDYLIFLPNNYLCEEE